MIRAIVGCLVVLTIAVPFGLTFSIHLNEDSKQKQESSRSLKRRFWGDDIQPCIVKYCIKYVETDYYWKCLGKFCPEGLLVTPRQLSQFRRDLVEPSGPNLYSFVCQPSDSAYDGENPLCPSGQCDQQNSDSDNSFDTLNILQHIELGICLRRYCYADSVSSISFRLCAERSCCSKLRAKATPIKEDSGYITTSKRRINDDLSQCIQSYCDGKHFRDRLLCIMKFCNRIKRL